MMLAPLVYPAQGLALLACENALDHWPVLAIALCARSHCDAQLLDGLIAARVGPCEHAAI